MEEISKEKFNEKNIISISSFALGTLLLIAFIITKSDKLLLPGILYLLFAIVINSFHLLATIIFHFQEKKRIKETLLKIGLILINIPIAYLYSKIVVFIFKH